MNDIDDYNYHLPDELIASEPPKERDGARLLVVERTTATIAHRHIRDLPALLHSGDRLVLNDTRVLPARLFGFREGTGGKWEGLYLDSDSAGKWRLLAQSGGKLRAGEKIIVRPAHPAPASDGPESTADSRQTELELTLVDKGDDGVWLAQPSLPHPAGQVLQQFGTMPLPPYIRRPLATAQDWLRYQTTFARSPGAVAAPTAGLHFTSQLLAACRDRGIEQTFVTLHVGIGTFRPIAVERLSEHRMHSEWCALSGDAASAMNATRQAGGRIVAVGTTAVRTLESAALQSRAIQATEPTPGNPKRKRGTGDEKEFLHIESWQGHTDLFIRPPYEYRSVDALLTNFHLPKSTLLVLVSAFAGIELIRAAYQAAIAERYRFYSYGDAMLIL